jgi:hypothetical protein
MLMSLSTVALLYAPAPSATKGVVLAVGRDVKPAASQKTIADRRSTGRRQPTAVAQRGLILEPHSRVVAEISAIAVFFQSKLPRVPPGARPRWAQQRECLRKEFNLFDDRRYQKHLTVSFGWGQRIRVTRAKLAKRNQCHASRESQRARQRSQLTHLPSSCTIETRWYSP